MEKIFFNNNLTILDFDYVARKETVTEEYTFVCRCNKIGNESLDTYETLQKNIWQVCAVVENKDTKETFFLYPNGDKSYSFSPYTAVNDGYDFNFAKK